MQKTSGLASPMSINDSRNPTYQQVSMTPLNPRRMSTADVGSRLKSISLMSQKMGNKGAAAYLKINNEYANINLDTEIANHGNTGQIQSQDNSTHYPNRSVASTNR